MANPWAVYIETVHGETPTTYDITDNVISFDLRMGLQYAPDYLDMVVQTPIVDTAATTWAWGSNLTYATQIRIRSGNGYIFFVGYITSFKIEGEIAKIKLMQSFFFQGKIAYTGAFASSNQSAINTALETASGIDMEPYGGGSSPYWVSNSITGVSYTDISVSQILNRIYEITDATNYYLQVCWNGPYSERDEAVLVTGTYGGYDRTATALTLDNYLLSAPVWEDARSRVVNSVTVKYTGGSVTVTDATSIAAYGTISTVLNRPEYNNSTDATALATSIVALLKDPKERCTVQLDYSEFEVIDSSLIGAALFRVTDSITGKTVDMGLKEAVIHYPSYLADCTFDEVGLNTDDYGGSLDVRVNTLEISQPDQTVNSDSTPTFASVTSTGDVSVGDELRITTDTAGTIKARDILYFKDSDSASEAQYIDMVSAAHTIAGSTQHTSANLNLNRGADTNGWDHWIYWKRYGAAAAATPNWRLGRTGAQEPLRFQYTADDTNFSDVLTFNVDQSVTVAAGLGCVAFSPTGLITAAAGIHLYDTAASANVKFQDWGQYSKGATTGYERVFKARSSMFLTGYRVYFQGWISAGAGGVMQVRKNGVAVSATTYTLDGTANHQYYEGVAAGGANNIQPGDYIEIWTNNPAGCTTQCRGLGVAYDFASSTGFTFSSY